MNQVQMQMDADSKAAEAPEPTASDSATEGATPAAGSKAAEDDPMKALQDSLDKDQKK
jgi:hypothetical protein